MSVSEKDKKLLKQIEELSKSCSKCTKRRMCHKRRDADTKIDELVEIVGRDMVSLTEEHRSEVAHKVGCGYASKGFATKGAYLQEIVAKLVRENLFVSMAILCNAYHKADESLTVAEFKALPAFSNNMKPGDCYVPGAWRENQQNVKAGDKAFVLQLKEVKEDGVDIVVTMFTLREEE